MIPSWFPDADTWSAWAQIATVGVAGWALIYARGQVKEARETRERVAQPDVVVYIERDPQNWHYMDLVVKNFGQTPAYNVRVKLPPLDVVPYENMATGEQVTELWVPTNIAVLAPGQEWRTSWDSGIEREEYKGELKNQFVGQVDFDDAMIPPKRSYGNPISLDANMLRNSLHVTTDKAKSPEKALYNIAETLKGYTKQHSGLWIYGIPGEDERHYHEQRVAAFKARSRQNLRELMGKGGQQNQPTNADQEPESNQ